MKKELQLIRKSIDKEKGTLLVLVGESGAGKSTLCKFINCPDIWYSSSGMIIKKLNKQGIPITHDNIHNFANRAYFQNPEWQVKDILKKISKKGIIILDGPRRIKEVQALNKSNINMVILRIFASEKQRFERLQSRDNIDKKNFKKVLQDESQETELKQLLLLSDITIENNGSLENIQMIGRDINKFIESVKIK